MIQVGQKQFLKVFHPQLLQAQQIEGFIYQAFQTG
jgi:hypothetical protein